MDRVRSHDQGFVSAPPGRVFGLLADPASYPGWWPGTSNRDGGLTLPLPAAEPARPERERDGVGLYLAFEDGSLEWYLEPFDEGTIVNAFLDVPASVGRPRRLRVMRSRIREGMVGLKRRLEGQP